MSDGQDGGPGQAAVFAEVSSPGLTTTQVAERHSQGQSNYVKSLTSRPVTEILRANIFTIFNAVLTAAVIVVLLVGHWQDAVFGLVMILNSAIGVFSELRSKRTLDSVAVLDAPRARAWRDGRLQEIPSVDIVVDDVLQLRLGDQISADGVVATVQGLEVDESILTGESLPVHKAPGDELLSGTAVVSGAGTMRVQKIGKDSWVHRITDQARIFSPVTSEIQSSINVILRWITILLPFVVILLFWSQARLPGASWRVALVAAVAGVVGMIPQGLVLLTSMNFGIAAQVLARRGVLVQELPAVEVLARIDYLCLDKTGTLTTGGIEGKALTLLPGIAVDRAAAVGALSQLTRDETNASASAIRQLVRAEEDSVEAAGFREIPFSSVRKWSALTSPTGGTWVLGAPEILFAGASPSDALAAAQETVAAASARGARTLCLSHSGSAMGSEDGLPAHLEPVLIAELEEQIRPDAARTLGYFGEQGVRVVVISGDSTTTVAAIAGQLGLGTTDGGLHSVDARTLPQPGIDDFDRIVAEADVFGRVTPDQKRDIVSSLRRQGHTVAMTGDGVNDALALKEADLGIAMGNGAPATKAVSRMVLLNGEFSVLPGVLAEGRRIIANMERVSSLFLAKTTYALLIAVIVSATGILYPFLPRHLTYVGWFTIGTPAFFLALGPNSRRYLPGFLRRTLWVAVPAGTAMGVSALAAYLVVGQGSVAGQTAATLTLIVGALWLVSVTARPITGWRAGLLAVMASGAVVGLLVPPVRHFFALGWPTPAQAWIILGFGALSCVVIELARLVNGARSAPKRSTEGESSHG